MAKMRARLEAMEWERLRELGYQLERALPEHGEVRAKSRAELADTIGLALELLAVERPEANAALLAEFELDGVFEPAPGEEGATEEGAPEEVDNNAAAEAAAADEGDDESAPSSAPKRVSPFDYVQVMGQSADPELQYGQIVPAPKPSLYEVIPYAELTRAQAKRAVEREGAELNTDQRWSHGAVEEWAKKRSTR